MRYKYLGSSQNPEQLALTVKGVLLTIIPVAIMILGSLNITLNPEDAVSFVNTLFGIFTTCLTLYGLGRKIYIGFTA